jgi:hypothetical protein
VGEFLQRCEHTEQLRTMRSGDEHHMQ